MGSQLTEIIGSLEFQRAASFCFGELPGFVYFLSTASFGTTLLTSEKEIHG
jgi:hypothetical protein